MSLVVKLLNFSYSLDTEKDNITINYHARIERGEENPSFEVIKGLLNALKIKSSEILPF